MRLLFIENRNKTFLWDAVTKELELSGNEIHWLIQNKFYIPKTGNKHIIKYPGKKFIGERDGSKQMKKIIRSDRQMNFFGMKSDNHFYYYDFKIKQLLEEIKPDVVFGESTALHELLTIKNCQERGILYLNPNSCRYPVGRFSFYKNNTLEPYGGSGDEMTFEKTNEVIKQIVKRTSVPDYMKLIKPSKTKQFKDRFIKTVSYLFGEKYNTPSPIVKLKIEKQLRHNILSWDENAVSKVNENNKFVILYLLQLQPEANIDVWGHEYRDQLSVIKHLAQNTDENTLIYIKPNPKLKYELSEELVNFVNSNSRVISLKHEVKVSAIFNDIDLIVTVTGTIAIEAVLADKPVVTLVHTINNTNESCVYLKNINEFKQIITSIRNNTFPGISAEDKGKFMNLLNKTSYPGIISDPYVDKSCIADENVNMIVKAFQHVMSQFKVPL